MPQSRGYSAVVTSRMLASFLAAVVWLGAPLHCLAENLHSPEVFVSASTHGNPLPPAVRGVSNCCHPEALLPVIPEPSAARLSQRRLAPPAAFLASAAGARDVLALDHGPPHERGRPFDGPSSRRNLPLLI